MQDTDRRERLWSRWIDMIDKFGFVDPTCKHEVWEEIVKYYSEPHRHYHTLQHIDECLDLFDALEGDPCATKEVEWAIWMHDIVYDPRSKMNEDNSCAVSATLMTWLDIMPPSLYHINGLIMATKTHDHVLPNTEQSLLVDIDLGILGAANGRFVEYEQQIRREYGFVHRDDYYPAREKIMLGFASKSPMYQHAELQRMLGPQAAKNLYPYVYEASLYPEMTPNE